VYQKIREVCATMYTLPVDDVIFYFLNKKVGHVNLYLIVLSCRLIRCAFDGVMGHYCMRMDGIALIYI